MKKTSKNQKIPARRRQPASSSSESRRPSEVDLQQRYAFRRNRTLTGSASSEVVSAGRSDVAQLKSPRVRSHDLAQHRRLLGVVLFGVTLAVIILFILVSQFTASVVVRSTDARTQLDGTYVTEIERYLQAQPVERLRFMTNQAHLNQYLQSVAPEVLSVSADGSAGFGMSAFVVKVRTPIAGWNIGSAEQYVDNSGTSFARNYFDTPAVQIIDNSGVHAAIGKAVASDQFLGFVGRVVGLAAAGGHTVTQVIIPQGTTRQVELRLKDVPYPIKVSVDRPAGEQVEDMARSVRWLASQQQAPQYLDVRVSGRAFYL